MKEILASNRDCPHFIESSVRIGPRSRLVLLVGAFSLPGIKFVGQAWQLPAIEIVRP